MFLFIAMFLFAICASALEAYILMVVWNNVIISVFNVATLNFWQMWGILVFINIITGSFRFKVDKRY